MYKVPEYPDAPLADWRVFSSQLSPYFKEAISRESIDLPYWLNPMARGVLIAGPALLRGTAYKRYRGLPPEWKRVYRDIYQRNVGKTRLRVRPTNDRRAWLISRWGRGDAVHVDKHSDTLVFLFGATPVAGATRNEAMHLAYWFELNEPIPSFRWIKAAYGYLPFELTIAIRRAAQEGLSISWDHLWASCAHKRRVNAYRGRSGPLPLPVDVRVALRRV
jgi:hypothetical protein